jgi:hypothetical protein
VASLFVVIGLIAIVPLVLYFRAPIRDKVPLQLPRTRADAFAAWASARYSVGRVRGDRSVLVQRSAVRWVLIAE